MQESYKVFVRKWFQMFAFACVVSMWSAAGARAGLVLDISSVANADVAIQGTGSGATFAFQNNGMGQGFDITKSSGLGDAVGLFGTINGTFSYSTASITSIGPGQTAPVSTSSGATLAITDSKNVSLTAAISGVDIATLGTAGVINVDGAINLTNVHYSGTNTDLLELKNDVAASGGIVALTFQFVPGATLTQMAAGGSDPTSYSGTIATASIPEPGTLLLGCIALGTIAVGATWRKYVGPETK
jgi:hypothetical protein